MIGKAPMVLVISPPSDERNMALHRVGTKSTYPPLAPEERLERSAAFSPGGRLLQVEYARECPNSGSLALAFRFRGGVLLAKGRLTEPELGHRIPLIWRVTPATAYVANGNLGDMFHLRDVIAERKSTSMSTVGRTIRNTLHDHAVRTDVRPLALLVLLGSVEDGRSLVTGFDVTGSQFECDAWAFGQGDMRARGRLRKAWRADLGLRDARNLVTQIYGRQSCEIAILRRRR